MDVFGRLSYCNFYCIVVDVSTLWNRLYTVFLCVLVFRVLFIVCGDDFEIAHCGLFTQRDINTGAFVFRAVTESCIVNKISR